MDEYRNPFTIIIDSREQQPWNLEGITRRYRGKDQKIIVPTEFKSLKTGDYSISGYEDKICVERKSPQDAYSTITHDRERFIRELERMQSMQFAAVIIECEWQHLLRYCSEYTRGNSASLDSSILAFNQRFSNVHFYYRPKKVYAAKTCFKILDRFYRDFQKG